MISIHIAVEDSCLERECYEVKQNEQGENILYVVFRADKRKLPRFSYSEIQRNLLYEKWLNYDDFVKVYNQMA